MGVRATSFASKFANASSSLINFISRLLAAATFRDYSCHQNTKFQIFGYSCGIWKIRFLVFCRHLKIHDGFKQIDLYATYTRQLFKVHDL